MNFFLNKSGKLVAIQQTEIADHSAIPVDFSCSCPHCQGGTIREGVSNVKMKHGHIFMRCGNCFRGYILCLFEGNEVFTEVDDGYVARLNTEFGQPTDGDARW
jgi:hypothetical protein